MHKKKRKVNRRNSKIINALIISGAVLIILVLSFCSLGIIAANLTTVYPNVRYGEVELGGLTYTEALNAISEADVTFFDETNVTVVLTDDVSIVVSGEDAGFAGSAADAAHIATKYGRTGGFVGNTFKYLKSIFAATDLADAAADSFDAENVKSIISEAAANANHAVTESSYTVEVDQLVVQKGAPVYTVDESAVYEFIHAAFTGENNGDVETDQFSEAVVSEGYVDTIDFDAIYNEIYVEPVNASYNAKTGEAVNGVVGVSFDVAAAKAKYDEAAPGSTVEIELVITQPEVDLSDIEDLLFRDCFVSKTTSMRSSSANRINNITLAAQAMNETILLPGETFSYNQCLGKRTAERGYKSAGAYAGGLEVEQIGGGICQGSSTLYYCVLMSELKVIERSNHMFNVSYLPLSIDATVDWGNIDFRFQNNRDYPIKIIAYVADKQLTVEIWGTKTDTNVVELKSVHTGTIDYETVEELDPTFAPGQTEVKVTGHKGYTSELYRLIYDEDGNLISKTLISKDRYKVRNKIILVGTLTNPEGGEGTGTGTDTGTGTGESTGTGTGTGEGTGTGTETGGAETGGTEDGGTETGGTETEGNETGGTEAGGTTDSGNGEAAA